MASRRSTHELRVDEEFELSRGLHVKVDVVNVCKQTRKQSRGCELQAGGRER